MGSTPSNTQQTKGEAPPWWWKLRIPAVRRQKHDFEFKASQGYLGRDNKTKKKTHPNHFLFQRDYLQDHLQQMQDSAKLWKPFPFLISTVKYENPDLLISVQGIFPWNGNKKYDVAHLYLACVYILLSFPTGVGVEPRVLACRAHKAHSHSLHH